MIRGVEERLVDCMSARRKEENREGAFGEGVYVEEGGVGNARYRDGSVEEVW